MRCDEHEVPWQENNSLEDGRGEMRRSWRWFEALALDSAQVFDGSRDLGPPGGQELVAHRVTSSCCTFKARNKGGP
jgi:hypothetical protein